MMDIVMMKNAETVNIVMMEDLNPHGTLFGGKIMSEMDKFAAIVASEALANFLASDTHKKKLELMSSFSSVPQIEAESKLTLVTRKVSDIEFGVPIKLHDVYKLKSVQEIQIGKSSITVSINVYRKQISEPATSYQLATSGTFVFVAVDEFGDKFEFNYYPPIT